MQMHPMNTLRKRISFLLALALLLAETQPAAALRTGAPRETSTAGGLEESLQEKPVPAVSPSSPAAGMEEGEDKQALRGKSGELGEAGGTRTPSGRGVPGAAGAYSSNRLQPPTAPAEEQTGPPRKQTTDQSPSRPPFSALNPKRHAYQPDVDRQTDGERPDMEVLTQGTPEDNPSQHRITGVDDNFQKSIPLFGSEVLHDPTADSKSTMFPETQPSAAGLEEERKVVIPSFWKKRGINKKIVRILDRLGQLPPGLRSQMEQILQEILEDVNQHGYKYATGYRTTLKYRGATEPDRIIITLEDQTARYQKNHGLSVLPFEYKKMPPPPENPNELEAIVEKHAREMGEEGGLGSYIIRGYLDSGLFILHESFDPEEGNRYAFVFPMEKTQKPSEPAQEPPAAGLEEVQVMPLAKLREKTETNSGLVDGVEDLDREGRAGLLLVEEGAILRAGTLDSAREVHLFAHPTVMEKVDSFLPAGGTFPQLTQNLLRTVAAQNKEAPTHVVLDLTSDTVRRVTIDGTRYYALDIGA